MDFSVGGVAPGHSARKGNAIRDSNQTFGQENPFCTLPLPFFDRQKHIVDSLFLVVKKIFPFLFLID